MLIHLPSVASYIDTNDALVYAAYQNGDVDLDSATSVSECSPDWIGALSREDREKVDVVERYLNLKLHNMIFQK